MKKISNLLMMALLTVGMGLTSCDEQLDNAVTPYTPGVTPESEVAVTSITLDEAVLRIDIYNTTETLTATVSPAEATDKTVTWKSSDETVATVDANGQVTPIKAGTVTIEATAGDKTATSTVYVYDEINTFFSGLDQSINVPTGKSYMFTSYGGTPSNTKINIEDGATVTLNGINFTQQIACAGNATIILADGSTNTVTAPSGKAGIQIGGTGGLVINAETAGTGTLTATGGNSAAGIGTSKNETGGNIVINGGTITAKGGDVAAGIGTGFASSTNTCGYIMINGGTVIATGSGSAAGIGTGYANGSTNTCDFITIIGGTVIATGGGNAAGIGTGTADGTTSTNTCGDITIVGGTVTAAGGSGAAGIGTGYTNGSTIKCGAIAIDADVTSVTATKGDGSPNSIGIGKNGGGTQKCGTIRFDTEMVYGGGDWTTYNSMTAGTYGDLKLVISKKNFDDDTWTLTPVK